MMSLALLLGVLGSTAALELEEAGRNHLYNMEIEAAKTSFRDLSRLEPASPAGPYYEATTLWMEEFSRRGGMAGSTFRTGRYWSGRKTAPDESLDRDFKRLIAEAIERADALLSKSPENEDALYFRGSAEGLSSAYLASVERSYYAAYQAGKRAKAYHEKLLALDPDYADACLLPGIFEYTIATLPRTLRILGFLVGLRGSKEKGLELIEEAVRKGQRTRWVARLSLSVLHEREKRYGSAHEVLRELEKEFPRNPFLPMERGSLYLLQKNWLAARRSFERVQANRASGWPGYELVPKSLVSLRIAESYLFQKRYQQALSELDEALSSPGVPDWVRSQIFVRRGMASDALGRRAAAESDYRRALRLDTDEMTTTLAERYLDQPFQ